jgi:hypothetical protein
MCTKVIYTYETEVFVNLKYVINNFSRCLLIEEVV